MSLETFILCHDQDIINSLINNGKYRDIGTHKFIFMGPGQVDKLDREKVIIARELPDNIEHFRNGLQYCGWYAIYKNNLCTSEKIRLIDYDVDIIKWSTDLNEKVKSFVNYDITFYYDEGFGRCVGEFQNNVLNKTSQTTKSLAENFIKNTGIKNWFSAADVMTYTDIFKDYMAWLEPIFFANTESPCFSFHFERYFCIYCMEKGIPYQCCEGETEHKQLQSHPYYNFT